MGNEQSTIGVGEVPPDSIFLEDTSETVDESILFTEPECFVYRVGVRASAQGHTAASWGLDAPLLTGNLRVTAIGGLILLAVWKKGSTISGGGAAAASAAQQRHPLTLLPLSSGQTLIALCKVPLTPGSPPLSFFMEPVLDSSRYFVLRCVPPPGRVVEAGASVLLGIGFRHREAAFTLKACLADHVKCFERQAAGAAAGSLDQQQRQQHALPQSAAGQEDEEFGSFTSAPGGAANSSAPITASPTSGILKKSIPLLRPPPPPPTLAVQPGSAPTSPEQQQQQQQQQQQRPPAGGAGGRARGLACGGRT
jgi:hypothetical protein